MAANLSSKQAANRLGQTELCLKQMEAGSRRVSAGTLARAAQVFNVEIRWFFTDAEPPTSKHSAPLLEDEKNAKSILILNSLRQNKTLSQLCEALRESEYAPQKDAKVA